MAWNKDSINVRLKIRGENSERYLNQIRAETKNNSNYQTLYDEHLAEFCIANRLCNSGYIETKERYLKELKSMLSNPIILSEVFDQDHYIRRWNYIIEELIDECSEE